MYYWNRDRNDLSNLEERLKPLIEVGKIYRVICSPSDRDLDDLDRTAIGYYFDENYIWKSKVLTRKDVLNDYGCTFGYATLRLSTLLDIYRSHIACSALFKSAPTNIVSCISRLLVGESYEDLCEMICTRPYGTFSNEHAWRTSGNVLDRHIGAVGKPIFYRSPENENKKTFDYMHVECSIVGVEDRMKFAKEHKKDIYGYVLEKVKNNRSFKKYGVPINVLKIEKAQLSKTGMLYLVFGLKEIKKAS